MAQGTQDDPIDLESDSDSQARSAAEPSLQASKSTQPSGEQGPGLLDEVGALEALCWDLLASPYEPYWARRAEEFSSAEELLAGPAFVCPECGSAI